MIQSITRILVAIDFSDNSRNCIQTAIAIASRQKASLTLLHVLDDKLKLSGTKARNKLRELYSVQREAISYAIKRHEPEYKVKVIESDRMASHEINALAKEEDANLIVMGKFGVGGNLKLNIGSTLKNVLQDCTIPILVIPPEGSWLNLNRIILPVRLKQGEIEKYEYLRPIIHRNKAELLIAGFSKSDAPGKVKELLAMVKEIKIKLAEDEVTTTSRFSVTQTIGWEVNSFSRSFYADLIVLSAQIDDEETSIYSGIYSRQILDYSKIPILCVG